MSTILVELTFFVILISPSYESFSFSFEKKKREQKTKEKEKQFCLTHVAPNLIVFHNLNNDN